MASLIDARMQRCECGFISINNKPPTTKFVDIQYRNHGSLCIQPSVAHVLPNSCSGILLYLDNCN